MSYNLIIGAGFSRPLNGPTVEEITNIIFEEPLNGWIFNSEMNSYIFNNLELDNFLNKNLKIITRAKVDLIDIINFIRDFESFFKRLSKNKYFENSSNYEELIGFFNNVLSSIQYKNELTTIPLVCLLRKKVNDYFGTLDDEQFVSLIYIIHEIILARVILKIEQDISEYQDGELNFVEQLISKCELVNVLTLNYDLVFEQLLKVKNIDYSDGYETKYYDRKNDINLLKQSEFVEEKKVKLFKLHGSLDDIVKTTGRKVKKRISCKFDYKEKDKVLEKFKNAKFRTKYYYPNIIAGSPNKESLYLNEKYFKVLFNSTLYFNKLNNTIVIGYSFGDNGVNNLILNWLNQKKENKLLIIDPYISIENNKTLKRWFDSDNLNSRIRIVNKDIQVCNIDDLDFLF